MQSPIKGNSNPLSEPNPWNQTPTSWLASFINMKNPAEQNDISHTQCQDSNHFPFTHDSPCEILTNPRIILVCRRTERKNKYINYIGEYHIDLIQKYGGIPIILPRTPYTIHHIEQYFPIDGIIIAEGEDLGMNYEPYGKDETIPSEIIDSVKAIHTSDATSDSPRDELEWKLLDFCIDKSIPFLGLCRGCQILNVKCGGTLWYDIKLQVKDSHFHIDYNNYDQHRHPIYALPNTPMTKWFGKEYSQRSMFPTLMKYLENEEEAEFEIATLSVNSYHHQGIKLLSPRFRPMAISPDGLIEAYYDPNKFDPEKGRFCAAFQFHPERMMNDYPGCLNIYKDFVTACTKYKTNRISK